MKAAVLQKMIETGMGSNALCTQCRSATNVHANALGPYIICESRFRADSLLFVGKVARGDELPQSVPLADRLEDVTAFGAKAITENWSAYHSYTREIIENVYGSLEMGIPHVSFTNIVKCNSGTQQDTVAEIAKDFCIAKNRFIWEEIELIRPHLVVFYTHTAYDSFIANYLPSYATSYIDNDDREEPIGQKSMPWWDRSFYDDQRKEVLRFLRVGHPERKKRADYVTAISLWITSHKNPVKA